LLFFIGTGLNIPFFGVWPYGQEGIPPLFKKKKGREGFPNKKNIWNKKSKQKKKLFETKNANLLSGPTGRLLLPVHGSILRIEQLFDPEDRTMVGSSGSNNCSIQRIEPWLTKKANLFLFAFFVVSLQKSFFCLHGQEGRATTTTSLLHFCFSTTYPLKSVSFQKCKQ